MTDDHRAPDDPAVVGVPPETPDEVRPSATGLVTGPVEGETDVHVADVTASSGGGRDAASGAADLDQLLEDAEGGLDGSLLDVDDGGPSS
jgi:hypothetical protein